MPRFRIRVLLRFLVLLTILACLVNVWQIHSGYLSMFWLQDVEEDMPVTPCPRYTYSGENELEQLYQFWSKGEPLVLTQHLTSPRTRQYDIHVEGSISTCHTSKVVDINSEEDVYLWSNPSVLSDPHHQCEFDSSDPLFRCTLPVRIEEQGIVDGNCTKLRGGSNFYVEIYSSASGGVWVCPVQDTFNGTYIARCPLFADLDEILDNCYQIAVMLMHIDFNAYMANITIRQFPYNILLSNHKICAKSEPQGTGNSSTLNEVVLRPPIDGWILGENGWSLMVSGIPFKNMTSAKMKKCMELNAFTMVGPSHMRYMTDYLWNEVYGPEVFTPQSFILKQKHLTFSYGNVTFVQNHHAYDFPRSVQILDNTTDTTKNVHDVVVFKTGHWDMLNHNLTFYLGQSIPVLVEELLLLQKKERWRNARFIWFETVPYPDNYNPVRGAGRGRRNNYAIAASLAWLRHQLWLAGARIEEFDSFTWHLPRNTDVLCGAHYVCRQFIRRGKFEINGEVGISILNILLQKLCS